MAKASRETAITGGTEIIEFSPTEEYSRTMDTVAKNFAAAAANA